MNRLLKGSIVKLNILNNNRGFTLMELIITISIVAIAAGLSGFGLNALFSANLDNIAHDITSELRNIRFREVSEYNNDYQMVFTYDSDKDNYGYIVQKRYDDSGTEVTLEVKRNDYKSTLRIYREETIGVWIEMKDSPINLGGLGENSLQGTFSFSASSGGIADVAFSGGTIESLNLNSLGSYKIVNIRNNEEIKFIVIKKTGRVIIDE